MDLQGRGWGGLRRIPLNPLSLGEVRIFGVNSPPPPRRGPLRITLSTWSGSFQPLAARETDLREHVFCVGKTPDAGPAGRAPAVPHHHRLLRGHGTASFYKFGVADEEKRHMQISTEINDSVKDFEEMRRLVSFRVQSDFGMERIIC